MRLSLTILALAAVLPAQQQCFETHAGETLATNQSTGGPNLLLAFKLTLPSNATIEAAQVLTGLQSGPATFQIWSHDAQNDRPGQPLGSAGSIQQSKIVTWQGTTFSAVSLTAGQPFWLVWGMPNSSRLPVSTSTNGTVPYRGSFDGGVTWSGANNGASPWPPKPYEIRLFCSYPTMPITTLGSAKPGSGGIAPQLEVLGWPANGNQLGIVLDDAAPSVPAVLAIGTPGTTSLGMLGTLEVMPLVVVPVTTSAGRSPGDGTAVLPITLPAVSSIGFPLAVQWWVVDGGATAGLAHSAGALAIVN